jgi:hypothetical protein
MRKVFALFGTIALEGMSTVNKNLSAVDKEARKAQKTIAMFGKNVEKAGVALTKMTAPIAGLGAAMVLLANKTGQYADKLLDLEQITGLTTDNIQGLENVAREAGVSFDGLTGTIARFTSKLPQVLKDGGPAADAIKALGVNVFDSNGNIRDMNELFPEMVNKLQSVENITQRNILSQQIFGRELKDLAPVLGMTTTEFNKLFNGAQDMAGYMSEDAIKSADAYRKEMEKLKATFFGYFRELSMNFIPILRDTVIPLITNEVMPAFKKLIDTVKGATDWFNKLDPTLKNAIVRFGAIAVVMGPLLIIIGKVIVATKAFTAAVILNNAALAVNPIGAVIIAVAALTVGVWAAVEAYNALSVATKKMNNAQKSSERIQELSREYNDLKANIEAAGESAESVTWFDGQTFRTERLGVAKAELAGILAQIKFINGELNKPASAPAASGGGGGGGVTAPTGDGGASAREAAKAANQARLDELNKYVESAKQKIIELTKTDLEQVELREQAALKELELKGATSEQVKVVQEAFALEMLDVYAKQKDEEIRLEEQKADRIKQIGQMLDAENDRLYQLDKQRKIDGANMAIDGLYQVFGIAQGINQNRMAELDISTAKEIEAINATKLSEEEKQIKIQELEENAAAKKKELMRKQAKQEKAAGIFSIIINTATAIMKAVAQLGPIAGAIAGVAMGILGAAQIAVVASKPLPMAKGGLVKGGRGGVLAEVGEAESDEIVIPLRTGLDTFANMFIDKIKAIAMPDMSFGGMGSPAMAGAGGNNYQGRPTEHHWHIGTLIADDRGIKELERRQKSFRVSESQRMGE